MLSWTTDQKEMAEKKYIINILHIQVHVYHSFRVKTTFAKHSKQILMQEHSQIFQFIPNITARGISSPYKPVCNKAYSILLPWSDNSQVRTENQFDTYISFI